MREEIFYREAVRRGLDDGDVLVRRRLAQKLSFLIEDLAAVEQPGDDELRRFHQQRADRYAEPARLSFKHVFFSRDRRADAAADAGAALASLRLAAASAGSTGSIGDPFMLHSEYAGRSRQEVRELFGPEFAEALFALAGLRLAGSGSLQLWRAPGRGDRASRPAHAPVRGGAPVGAARFPAGASRGGERGGVP